QLHNQQPPKQSIALSNKLHNRPAAPLLASTCLLLFKFDFSTQKLKNRLPKL
ncbi:hypothetical protein MEW_00003, partial [Candida albicans P60002]